MTARAPLLLLTQPLTCQMTARAPLLLLAQPLTRLQVTSSWAGFYDYNYWDHNALLNVVPGFSNLLAATGFSGHGVQQAPAAGKVMILLFAFACHVPVKSEISNLCCLCTPFKETTVSTRLAPFTPLLVRLLAFAW